MNLCCFIKVFSPLNISAPILGKKMQFWCMMNRFSNCTKLLFYELTKMLKNYRMYKFYLRTILSIQNGQNGSKCTQNGLQRPRFTKHITLTKKIIFSKTNRNFIQEQQPIVSTCLALKKFDSPCIILDYINPDLENQQSFNARKYE